MRQETLTFKENNFAFLCFDKNLKNQLTVQQDLLLMHKLERTYKVFL